MGGSGIILWVVQSSVVDSAIMMSPTPSGTGKTLMLHPHPEVPVQPMRARYGPSVLTIVLPQASKTLRFEGCW